MCIRDSLPAELFVVWTSRQHIRWHGIVLLLVGIAVGIPAGGLVLKLGEPSFLLVLLGGVLVVVGLVFLLLRDNAALPLPGWVSPITGLVSGLLTGLFGTGGPPLVLHFRLLGIDKTGFGVT